MGVFNLTSMFIINFILALALEVLVEGVPLSEAVPLAVMGSLLATLVIGLIM